jgi:5-methylcytosine-specific restriction endonuclease McrA
MAGSYCTVCRKRVPKGSRCSKHRIVSPSSKSWHTPGAQVVRLHVLKRDGFACVRCGGGERLQVHHVDAAEDGGPTTPENLATVCSECHVTIEAEKRRGLTPSNSPRLSRGT